MSRRHVTARTTIVVSEFDGMHLGHRALVSAARQRADHARQPLVGVVLDHDVDDDRLSSVDERLRSLLSAGCSSAVSVTCDLGDRSERSWRIADRIADMTRPTCAVFARLPGRSGGVEFPSVQNGLRRAGVHVVEVDRLTDGTGAPVAGGTIRAALRWGRVEPVLEWLGRPYELRSIVVHGSGLGHTIGFATANLDPPAGRVVPARGVYAGTVALADGTEHLAAVNIGHRPTVTGDGQLLIEAHLLDFDADIYDTIIAVRFVRWLRPELRFSGVDQLVAQLAIDVEHVRRVHA